MWNEPSPFVDHVRIGKAWVLSTSMGHVDPRVSGNKFRHHPRNSKFHVPNSNMGTMMRMQQGPRYVTTNRYLFLTFP